MPILEPQARRPVLLVDANVLIKNILPIARGTAVQKVALAELVRASGVRVVMSEQDVRPDEFGVSRIEVAIRTRVAKSKLPENLADQAIIVWREVFLPHMTILNPIGLSHTAKSLQVASPSRDPDDAALSLLGEVLDADAFATYDRKAFDGLYPVLVEESAHVQLFLAYRDARRYEEAFQGMVGLPALAGWTTWKAGAEFTRALKISPSIAMVGAVVTLAALLAYAPSRKWLGRQTMGYFELLETTIPTEDQAQQMAAAKARASVKWTGSPDVVVSVARLLIRASVSMTTTELVRALKVPQTPGELAQVLRQYSGMFLEESRGRWVIPKGPNHLGYFNERFH